MSNRWKILCSVLVLSGVSLLVAAFRLLWVRYEINSEAKTVAKLEYETAKAKDQLRMLESTVLESIQPHILKERIEGEMALPKEGQVIRMGASSEESAMQLPRERSLAV